MRDERARGYASTQSRPRAKRLSRFTDIVIHGGSSFTLKAALSGPFPAASWRDLRRGESVPRNGAGTEIGPE